MTVKLSIPAGLLIAGSVGRQTIGSLGSSEDSTTGSLKKPTFSERHPKAVRSVTVVGYLFCVSLAAILLSAYYLTFWSPKIQKPTPSPNVTMQCRSAGENGEHYVTHPRSSYSNSRHTHSPNRVIRLRPVQQSKGADIPQPSKLVSSPQNFESSQQHTNTSNKNSLQQRNNSDPGASLTPARHNTSSISSTKPNVTFVEKHQTAPATSEYYDDLAESTFVPNPSPSPKSIIFPKLLRNTKREIFHQKHYKKMPRFVI